MMKRDWISVGAVSMILLASCGGPKEEAKKETEKPAAAAPVVSEAEAATITGKVAFSGQKPKEPVIDMSATPACVRAHTTPVHSEQVVVNDNDTLRYVFVWVKSGLPDREWPVPTTPVELDQRGCLYRPHVIGVQTNQDIKIVNSDPTNHNIHPLPKVNQEWNQSQPPKGEPFTKHFPRQEVMIAVKCNVHPWMRSYIGVVSHPFFAVTGEDGTFTIKGLPPGKYTIEAWHEKYPAQTMEVSVSPKETKTVDFTFKG